MHNLCHKCYAHLLFLNVGWKIHTANLLPFGKNPNLRFEKKDIYLKTWQLTKLPIDNDVWLIISKNVLNDLYATAKQIFTFLIIKHFYLDVLKATCVILTCQENDDWSCTNCIILHCNYSHRFLLSFVQFWILCRTFNGIPSGIFII